MNLRLVPILLVALGVLSRLLPHPPNFVPITALALFAGVYMPTRWAYLIPLGAMLISDFFIGFYGLGMLFVYIAIYLQVMIGGMEFWKNTTNRLLIGMGAVMASIVFYIISNFGAWLTMPEYYTQDFSGLMQSYIMALPFFRTSLMADVFYTIVLFAVYELATYLARKYVPKISSAF